MKSGEILWNLAKFQRHIVKSNLMIYIYIIYNTYILYTILYYPILSYPILYYPILSYTIRLEDDDDDNDEDFKKSQARTPSHPGKNNS